MTQAEKYKAFKTWLSDVDEELKSYRLYGPWLEGFHFREYEILPELEEMYNDKPEAKHKFAGIAKAAWQNGYDCRVMWSAKVKEEFKGE